MAEIIEGGGGGGKGKHQKKRAKKHSSRIDMTPMVDLGFLLLTFFVLTTQFSKPKTFELVLPAKSDKHTPVNEEHAMTVLLTENPNKIYYYYGKFKMDSSIIKTTDYSMEGFRKIFRERNKATIEKVNALKEEYSKGKMADTTFKNKIIKVKEDLTTFLSVIVKPVDKAKYKNIIDLIDELAIGDVDSYALVDMSLAEKQLLTQMRLMK